jgi:hypothetical protein
MGRGDLPLKQHLGILQLYSRLKILTRHDSECLHGVWSSVQDRPDKDCFQPDLAITNCADSGVSQRFYVPELVACNKTGHFDHPMPV